ncbi:MAG: HAD family hydrolase [Eubacteriales bacterium]|jgi:HAD superfamily hydrolase (TIGR01509 family)
MRDTILFDMDMTLINSRPALRVAAQHYFDQRGVQVDAIHTDYSHLYGMHESEFFKYLCQLGGCEYDPSISKWIFEEYTRVAPDHVRAFEGAEELLRQLRKEGFTLVLGTSTVRSKARANFSASGLSIEELFDGFVCGEDVTQAKPSPEIFLLCAQKVGVEPHRCIVVEDALAGVRAAKAAGMPCVCVEYSLPAQRLLAEGADRVVPTLWEVRKAIDELKEQ